MNETEKNSEVFVDIARPEDAEDICHIRDEAWIDAYPNPELGISKEDIRLSAQGPENKFYINRVAHLKKKLSGEIPIDYPLFIAKQKSRTVGFVSPEIDEKGRKVISQIYIDPSCQSRGLGTILLNQALSALGEDKDIYLEVVSYNQKAIYFYEKFGFVKTNNPVEADPSKPTYLVDLPTIEMVRKVS